MQKDSGHADAILYSPSFLAASVAWWQSALGDRIPADWPLLETLVEKYIGELLSPKVGSDIVGRSISGCIGQKL